MCSQSYRHMHLTTRTNLGEASENTKVRIGGDRSAHVLRGQPCMFMHSGVHKYGKAGLPLKTVHAPGYSVTVIMQIRMHTIHDAV